MKKLKGIGFLNALMIVMVIVVLSALLTSCAGVVDSIQGRIPGTGSQQDHSEGLPFAKIIVYDNENPNKDNYYDRKVYNSADPSYIGLPEEFVLPEGWKIERDFSNKANNFVSYYTVKPPVDVTNEEILAFVAENTLSPDGYEVTSVIIHEGGQECSEIGLVDNLVRVNIYVGETWFYQPCSAIQN